MFDKSDGKSLRAAFLKHSTQRPDAPAMVVRGVTRSYGEVENTARLWARAIVEATNGSVERVGVFAYRSEVSYTGVLAALFSGATFVPLNPTFPPEKTAAMLQDARLQAVLVDKTCAAQLPAVLSGVACRPPLILPELEANQIGDPETAIVDIKAIAQLRPLDVLPPLAPDDDAYLLFTSGSTGKPKGVPVSHGNALYFMEVMSERYGIRPDDRFSQTFDQTFDLSVFDLFMAWSNGACVFGMTPVELLAPTKFITRNEITVWFSVPSVPAQMLRRNTLLPGSLPGLRWSLFCGEPLPRRSAEAWQAAAPNSVVENLYGPTEVTIACLVHRWNPDASPAMCLNDLVPIGAPYPGLGAMVVDEDLNSVADGEAGELCVSGPQTTRGYWQDPAKTLERYVFLPVSDAQTRRFYRTGDRVMRLGNGDYVFLSRMDDQVKVLGHRIELGEIEAAIRRHPAVEHVTAFGWPIQAGSAEGIVCFVSGDSVDCGELLKTAKTALPPYAVPKQIFVVPEMPLNPNGKVDRRALYSRLQTIGK